MKNYYGKQRLYAWLMKGLILHLFLFFSFFSVAGVFPSAGQGILKSKISLHVEGIKIKAILRKIEEEGTARFAYQPMQINVDRKVSLSIEDSPLENVLAMLFDNNVLFEERGDLVIIKSSEPDSGLIIQVSGKVTDAKTGEPMPGVNVAVKGAALGTSTDINGKYSLPVNDQDVVLLFSFIGYISQEMPVGLRSTIDIQLAPDQKQLDEVVVVGFGTQKKVSVVGAVQSIKPEELRLPRSQLSNSFAGRLAGVIAYQRSGEPGADGASFFIRGISTFSGATNPLIILDGVTASQADLNALAPEVIESFSILKDATATAIYGSRGANGVMIVTTKRGRNIDKPKINIRIDNSVSGPTSIPKFVDGARFMELYNEAVTVRGTGEVPYSQYKIDKTRTKADPYIFPDVDWYDEMFKPVSLNHTANLNVMGGGQKVDYFLSATLNNDNGVLKKFKLNSFDNNISVKRYSFQNNIHVDFTKSTFFSLKLNAQIRDYHGPSLDAKDIYGHVMSANPADFPIMFPNDPGVSGVRFGGKNGGRINSGYVNPFAEMQRGYKNNFQSTLLAIVEGEQELDFITKGLTIKGLASFKNLSNTNTSRQKGYNQYEAKDIEEKQDGTYSYKLSRIGNVQNEVLGTTNTTSGDRTMYLQTSLEYNRSFGLHTVTGLLLYNQQEYNVNNPTDLISSLPKRIQGLAGRVTYAFADRYLLEMNAGYNGSENFAAGYRFGFFPSVAGGYVISNEKYWKKFSSIINLLKVRFSWGLAGNDQIGSNRFVYLSDVNLTGQGYTTGVNQDYQRSGPLFNRFANPKITWELAEKMNLGFDLQLYKNLNFVFNFFRENRSDIFVQRQTIPDFLGTRGLSVYSNLGKVRNQGMDASIDYSGRINRDFTISVKGTFTYAHNQVTYNDEPASFKYKNLSSVGHPVNSLLGYSAERLFIDDNEIKENPLQQIGGSVSAGDIKYRDVTNNIDGLNMINSDDRVRMGYPTVPEIVYGFGPSIRYKKFDVSFFFQGVARTSFFMSGFFPFGTMDIRNVLTFIDENRWSPSNPDIWAKYPKLSKLDNPNNTEGSSFWLRSGSFLKLRNFEVGYTMKFARLYLSGYNLLTFSGFKHWDPEQGGGNGLTYPTQTVVNMGVQMSF